MENTIKTYRGHYIDVFFPTSNVIDIRDIAHALSFTARWGGHTKHFYSVAQHCLWCVDNAENESDLIKLELLLHDATEAYIGDMPKPIKNNLNAYKDAESALDLCIRSKYKLPEKCSSIIKEIDKKALDWENEFIKEKEIDLYESPLSVESKFLLTFNELTTNINERNEHVGASRNEKVL